MRKNPGRKERRKDARASYGPEGQKRSPHYRGKLHTNEYIDHGSRQKMLGLSKIKK